MTIHVACVHCGSHWCICYDLIKKEVSVNQTDMEELNEEIRREPPDVADLFEECLQHCQRGKGANNAQGFEECGEPAAYRVSWDGQKTWLYLCPGCYKKVMEE